MTLRLNLASGTDLKEGNGWLNLDIVPRWPNTTRGCDVVWDARRDKIPFPDGSADEVYAGYLLLHLAPMYHSPVLAEIRRVLQPGGILVVGEVDMPKVMERWLRSVAGVFAQDGDARAAELIWGEQGIEHGAELAAFDKHCCGFSEATLRRRLAQSGFDVGARVQIHHPDVWWELTLQCRRPV